MFDPTRIACVYVPNFALSLAGKDDPHLLLRPTVLVESEVAKAEVMQVSNKVLLDAVKVGMTRVQAETLCPELVAIPYDPQLEERTAAEVQQQLQKFAPLVQQGIPGRWFIELRGLKKLHGSENQIARSLVDSLKRMGLPVRVGVGDNNFIAQIAAEVSERYRHTIIPEQEGKDFLAQLSVKYLLVGDDIKEQLHSLGLRTIGQVAKFPVNELVERFSNEGWKLSQLSRGDDPSYFTPLPPEEDWSEKLIFDFPHYYLGAVARATQGLFASLFDRLGQLGLGCRSVEITLYCDDRQSFPVEVAVARPTLAIARFITQFRLQLRQIRLSGGVVEVSLIPISTATLNTQQLQLPETNTHSNTTVAAGVLEQRLLEQALRDSQTVVSPLPEQSFCLTTHNSAPHKKPAKTKAQNKQELLRFPYAIRSPVGLRLFSQPQSVEVTLQAESPHKLKIAGRSCQVTHLRGPWYLSGNWWEKEFERHYYEIETAIGSYLLFNDLQSSHWFVQGIFD